MSSSATAVSRRLRVSRTRRTGHSPDCDGDWCPGAWPADEDDLPCWPCFRDRTTLPAVEGRP